MSFLGFPPRTKSAWESNEVNFPFWFEQTTLSRVIDRVRCSSIFNQRGKNVTNQQQDVDKNIGGDDLGSLEGDAITNSLVLGWDGDSDPRHPRNWSRRCKIMITILLSWVKCFFTIVFVSRLKISRLYSFIVYCGSSICILSYDAIMVRYGYTREVASLLLSTYKFVRITNLKMSKDGTGPMLFSPLSEIPRIGRNPPYIISFFLYVVVSIILGSSAVDNFPAIVILRFFQGFFGSPCLATAGASIGDIYDSEASQYALVLWVACIYCGPALGPLFASRTISLQQNWRWPFWQIVLMAGPFLLILVCLLPETLPEALLAHRAKKLRQAGDVRICAPCEISQGSSPQSILRAMIKPVEITIKDPAIAFTCAYSALVYATYYSFFEAFPLVYIDDYQMSTVPFAMVFLSIIVGCAFGSPIYIVYIWYHQSSRSRPFLQESLLLPAIFGVVLAPIGLFIFAWSDQAGTINWSVPTAGIVIYTGSIFLVYQALLSYIPYSYPKFAASLFAANDFVRSISAAVFIMVTPYLYANIGVPKGVTILGSISVLGIVGMLILYRYGANMRARSRFAG
ncbi:hypothetical protein N7493_005843 [Penicillium malachiteum]|uniref:Major facilitator superfamily (MFS) profile domain-containing protein n=1 Tax=Penicillium malachiteum TaxID=1324776 RepID=A0AAD6HL77_9EURO|nr:hypothetical protein N7493_005843 [Penicillium malachiteum]